MIVNDKELLIYLQDRQVFLRETLAKVQKENRHTKSVEPDKIRIQQRGECYQYYLRTDAQDSKGRYLQRSQDKLVQEILQKEYNASLTRAIEKELNSIKTYLKNAAPTKISEIYSHMSKGRKRMIIPYIIDDEEFVAKWESTEYEGKAFREGAPQFYTQKGERVRSKSEVIIANLLNKHHIPYRYEFPIHVKNLGVVYPDFTALNVRKRKEIYLEHFGLLDDPEYLEKALNKIMNYEQTNIVLGENFIMTYETAKLPLDTRLVEKQLMRMLL